jgi:hypothetical protein
MVVDPARDLPNARPRELAPFLVTAGLAVLAVGQVVFLAGEQTWLGARRSATVVIPASFLRSESDWRGALIIGAMLSLIGLMATLVGVSRLARAVDAAAHSRLASSARRVAPSALYVTGGVLTLAVGLALYQAGQLGPLLSSDRLGEPALGQSLGAIVAVGGFGLLLRGTYRLVVNIQASAAAAESVMAAA